jgi:hypothetical protein
MRKIAAFLLFMVPALPAGAVDLVMVEETGCIYCAQWDEEIGPIYDKTAEGRFAPLRRLDRHDVGEDIDLQRRVLFTPTFLVVEDGRELGRLEGYPGEDFFWPLLNETLRRATDFTGDAE